MKEFRQSNWFDCHAEARTDHEVIDHLKLMDYGNG